MTDSQALRAALREAAEKAIERSHNSVHIRATELQSLLSDLDRVERDRDEALTDLKAMHDGGMNLARQLNDALARCAVLEKALGELIASANDLVDCNVQYHEGEIRIPGNGHGAAIHRVRVVRQASEAAEAALSSSPVVGGGEGNLASRITGQDQCGEQPEPTVEAAAALAGWRPIESAPKNCKVIAGYRNALGNWRSIMACYYEAGTLEAAESLDDELIDENGYAPEGWYEESETHDDILPCATPSAWMPLPTPPIKGEGE